MISCSGFLASWRKERAAGCARLKQVTTTRCVSDAGTKGAKHDVDVADLFLSESSQRYGTNVSRGDRDPASALVWRHGVNSVARQSSSMRRAFATDVNWTNNEAVGNARLGVSELLRSRMESERFVNVKREISRAAASAQVPF